MSDKKTEPKKVEVKTEEPKVATGLSLEDRGKKCSEEIAVVLKKYDMALAVNIEGAQEFINTLKPTLIETIKEVAPIESKENE